MTGETGGVDPTAARHLWHRLETVNAVTYFCEECRSAPAALGLPGFWMGYFGCRAAPLGAVGAGVVEATFHNFHPDRVRRAVPDAWAHASPAALVAARAGAAAAALRRLLGDDGAEQLATAVTDDLTSVVHAGDPGGRPLFAANRDLAAPADPVARLWQLATTLREHRGDGHVALLTGEGIDGCEAHVLVATATGTSPELYQRSRGWSPQDWDAARERLADRGLLHGDALTVAGRDLRRRVEDRTDELAAAPYRVLGEAGTTRLLEALGPAAARIAASGEITFPNPMGLPAPA